MLTLTVYITPLYVPSEYTTIQAAIDAALRGNILLVDDGIYTENINFLGKMITVQSVNGANSTTIDGNAASSVVIFDSGETKYSVLDGFTLTNGIGSPIPGISADLGGGAVACINDSSPTITNCTITSNMASFGGAGIISYASSPVVENCESKNNVSNYEGGGVLSMNDSSPTVNKCAIHNNTADSAGGAIYASSGAITIANSTISSNSVSSGTGGAMYLSHVSSVISNCVVEGNFAANGGAIYTNTASTSIVNSTFTDNSAWYGGAISAQFSSTLSVVNSILWGNSAGTANEINLYSSTAEVNYSNIAGGWTGAGNLDVDPQFVNAGAGDYHLNLGSLCIDAGTDDDVMYPLLPIDDLNGILRPWGSGFDMGAYEYNELDITPPTVTSLNPAVATIDIPITTDIVAHIVDAVSGVDQPSIVMTVDGYVVSPIITGGSSDYTLTYNPSQDFTYETLVNVTIQASDVAGNTINGGAGFSYSFTTESVPDLEAPSVAINSHNDGDIVNTPTITVTGTASDNVGVTSVLVNGIAATTNNGYANWSVQLPLSIGSNVVAATAEDLAENSTSTTPMSITYELSPGTYTEEWGNSSSTNHPGTMEDTYINLDTQNNSTSEHLNTYTWPTSTVANAVIMKYDLSAIPQGAVIQEAQLNLYLAEVGGDALYELSAHKIINYDPEIATCSGYTYDGINGWTPYTGLHNNIPLAQADIALPAEDVQSLDATLEYKSFQVTQMVSSWVSSPSLNYGLLINSDNTAMSDSFRFFASSESVNASTRPKLIITYSVATNIPDAPTDLFTSFTDCQVDLSWTDNSNNEDGFIVERTLLDSFNWVIVDSVDAGIESYKDTNDLIAGTNYNYRVYAYNAEAGSDYSNEASATIPSVDSDGDGVTDDCDNCTIVANPDQRDTDEDGYGNRCDADLNNSCFTNIADLAVFKSKFNSNDPDADFDGNGFVNIGDLAIFKSFFNQPPGPGLGFCE